MISISYLIPISVILGAIGLGSFIWCLNNDQYEDLDGASQRILFHDEVCPINNVIPRPGQASEIDLRRLPDPSTPDRYDLLSHIPAGEHPLRPL